MMIEICLIVIAIANVAGAWCWIVYGKANYDLARSILADRTEANNHISEDKQNERTK